MSKRSSFDIKKKILELVKSPKTFAELERKVNTGFVTIKENCKELAKFGFVTIKKIAKHSMNGKPYFEIKITEQGSDFLKKN